MNTTRLCGALVALLCFALPALAAPGYVGVYLEDQDRGGLGAVVQDVAAKSPAQAAGLRPGDLIIEWQGSQVRGAQDLIPLLKKSKSGQTIALAITRDGWRKTLSMTLGNLPGATPRAPRETLPAPKERGFLGIYLRQGPGGEPVIDGVLRNSPAERQGLRKDDMVLRVNGRVVTDAAGMIAEVGQHGPGDVVEFGVRRSGQVRTIKVRLSKRPAEPGIPQAQPKLKPAPAPATPNTGKRAYIGLALDDASGTLKVDDVKAQGPADRYGIRKGDVLIKVDGKAVKTIEDFVKAFRGKQAGQKIVLRIKRDGWQQDVPVVIGSR